MERSMNRIATRLFVCVSLPAIGLVGCKKADLAGKWTGDISCGDAGGVDAEYDIKAGSKDLSYDADGLVSNLTLDGVDSDIEIAGTWTQVEDKGPQVIKAESSCLVFQDDGEYEMDCAGLDEFGWDGEDTIETTIVNFLESGLDCTLALSR
jgi:hypothetical protein